MERPGIVAPPLSSPGLGSPSAFGIWWLAARPKTLPAAATPVIVGSACAHAAGGFALLPALASLAGALLLQIAANFANDVFDFEKGADTSARVGPLRAVQAGWVTPKEMRRALVVALGLSLLVGAYLVSIGGPVFVAIGLVSMAAAVAYTGGPYPLGYHGLGDVCVFIFFGIVAVTGTCFLQSGGVTLLAWCSAVPVGALATAILVVNNVRDHDTDVIAGKRTLPVRFGLRFGIAQYRALLVLAYLMPLVSLASARLDAWALLPWLTVPLAIRCSASVARDRGAALNATLARTGALLLFYGLLLAAAIVFGASAWLPLS